MKIFPCVNLLPFPLNLCMVLFSRGNIGFISKKYHQGGDLIQLGFGNNKTMPIDIYIPITV